MSVGNERQNQIQKMTKHETLDKSRIDNDQDLENQLHRMKRMNHAGKAIDKQWILAWPIFKGGTTTRPLVPPHPRTFSAVDGGEIIVI